MIISKSAVGNFSVEGNTWMNGKKGQGTVTEVGYFRCSDEKLRQQNALNKLLKHCTDGFVFYRIAVDLAEDIGCRKLLADMLKIKAEAVDLIRPLTRATSRLVSVTGKTSPPGGIKRPSLEYQNVTMLSRKRNRKTNCPISVELLEVEYQSLGQMRCALRDVKSRKLLRQLSSKLATMQIVRDQMKLANGLRN